MWYQLLKHSTVDMYDTYAQQLESFEAVRRQQGPWMARCNYTEDKQPCTVPITLITQFWEKVETTRSKLPSRPWMEFRNLWMPMTMWPYIKTFSVRKEGLIQNCVLRDKCMIIMSDEFRCKEGNKITRWFCPACATFSHKRTPRHHDTAPRYNFRRQSAIPQSDIVNKNNRLQVRRQQRFSLFRTGSREQTFKKESQNIKQCDLLIHAIALWTLTRAGTT